MSSKSAASPMRSLRPRWLPTHPACAVAASLAAREEGIPLSVLLHRRRGPRGVSQARALAIYLAHVALGAPLAEVAQSFGRHRSSAAHACRTVEERREAAGVDQRIDDLERAARRLAGREAPDEV